MADANDKKLDKEELMQKNVAYYSVMFSAFIESRNEVDRQILTLSVACIGGLLAFRDKIIGTCIGLVLTIIALICFVVTIGVVLFIFDKNSKYINRELRGDSEEAGKISQELKKYDRVAFWMFIISVCISASLIILSFFNK